MKKSVMYKGQKYVLAASDKTSEVIGILNETKDHIEEAAQLMKRASRLVRDVETGYNMGGNMEGYVINYLTGGHDSLSNKIEKYIDDLETSDEGDEDEGGRKMKILANNKLMRNRR